jgi:dolichol-phosphate mannosyltransferase
MRTLVAVPVYNEERHVCKVVSEITRYADCGGSDVLVIDDGSTDSTPCLLAKLPVDVVRHKKNLGYGSAIRAAFRWAQSHRYDWLITMDCDEQHEPRSLPDFKRAIEKDNADVISGSRYFSHDSMQTADGLPPADRRRINLTITKWVNEQLGHRGLRITDAFCGFKAYRVSALDRLDLTVDGYAIPLQFWVQCAAAGLRVCEIPIRLIYNDPNRSFGGPLDDPEVRLRHYRQVWEREMSQHPELCGPLAVVSCCGKG